MNTNNHELENKVSSQHAKSILAGLVVGGLVGAGTILLLAPQPGEQTREELKEGISDLRHRAVETVNDTLEQVKTKVVDAKTEVQSKAKNLQYQGQDLIVKQLDRVSHAAEEGKKALQGF